MTRKSILSFLILATAVLASSSALAQSPAPNRSQPWGTASNISVAVGASSQLLMPRFYYSDSESTLGWKARWHLSVLAPAMTLTAISLANEYVVKSAVEGPRPGCDDTNQGGAGCRTYGSPSTHSMAAFSALGQGTGIFLVDTLKWNDGRFSAGAFVGQVVLPLIAAAFTFIARDVNNPSYESGGQNILGAGAGLGLGLISGIGYALFQRPECGYSSGLVCW